jgi:hypothetical protein
VNAVRIEVVTNAYKIITRKLKGERTNETPRHRWGTILKCVRALTEYIYRI